MLIISVILIIVSILLTIWAIYNILNVHQVNENVDKQNQANLQKAKELELEINNKNQKEIKQGNKTSILSFIFNDFIFLQDRGLLRGKIEDWINYKEEIGKPYTAYSLKSFLNKVETKFNQFGEEKIIELIDYSLSNRYDGIIWERLKKDESKEIIPSWYKKEIKNEKCSPEELAELEELMKEFKK